jgi:hypothetical protein
MESKEDDSCSIQKSPSSYSLVFFLIVLYKGYTLKTYCQGIYFARYSRKYIKFLQDEPLIRR